MFQFTCLPKHISHWLQVLRPMVRHRHQAAPYGNGRLLLWWLADQVMATRPSPEEGVCYWVVASTLKGKTGQKHPLAKKGRLNEYTP